MKPAGWNDQVTEPCYAWNNVSGGTQQVGFGKGELIIRPGEHYFKNTPMPGYTGYTYPHPLVTGAARDEVADFNGDGRSDYLLYNSTTLQTVSGNMNNNVLHRQRVRPHAVAWLERGGCGGF